MAKRAKGPYASVRAKKRFLRDRAVEAVRGGYRYDLKASKKSKRTIERAARSLASKMAFAYEKAGWRAVEQRAPLAEEAYRTGLAQDSEAQAPIAECWRIAFGDVDKKDKPRKDDWTGLKVERVRTERVLENGVDPALSASFGYTVVRGFKWHGRTVHLRLMVPLAAMAGTGGEVPAVALAQRALLAADAAIKAAASAFGPEPKTKAEARRSPKRRKRA